MKYVLALKRGYVDHERFSGVLESIVGVRPDGRRVVVELSGSQLADLRGLLGDICLIEEVVERCPLQ